MWIFDIDLLAVAGSVVNRLGIGISGEHLQTAGTVAKAQLERVVVGNTIGDEIALTAELLSVRSAGAVDDSSPDRIIHAIFAVRPASGCAGRHFADLADAQANRGSAGVGLQRG